MATSHASAAVKFWDLRKQKTLTVLNKQKDLLKSVTALAYDPSGQYVAMGGDGGIKITIVKKWGIAASMDSKVVSGMAWSKDSLASCSSKERAVHFYGLSQ